MDMFMMLLLIRMIEGDNVLVFELLETPPIMASMMRILMMFLVQYIMSRYFRDFSSDGHGRQFWMYLCSGHWWEQIVRHVWVIDVDHTLTRDNYLTYFGMRAPLFDEILIQFSHSCHP